MPRKIFYVLLICFLSGIVSSAVCWANIESFVTREGNHLYAGGEPFYYTGTNNFYLSYFAQDDSYRPMVDEVFSEAKAMGLNVIRTWAFNDGGWNRDGYPTSWALQTSPGVYNENAFKTLDYALYKADTLGIRLIPTLVNNWDDYGGMNWYNSFSPTANNHDDFYTDSNTRQWYKNHVNAVLNRTNTYNGKVYKEDPTILAWELANEARAESDPTGNKLYNWIEEMSNHIKANDNKHLVTTGVEGFYKDKGQEWYLNGSTGTDFMRIHNLSSIDFATMHLYPDFWNWDLQKALWWISQHIQDSDILNKPVILEEFGKHLPTEVRDLWYQLFLAEIYNAASEGKAIAGSNFWMLEANGSGHNDGFSVFYPNDASTINILMLHANQMNNLVPEPATFILLGFGVLFLATITKRR